MELQLHQVKYSHRSQTKNVNDKYTTMSITAQKFITFLSSRSSVAGNIYALNINHSKKSKIIFKLCSIKTPKLTLSVAMEEHNERSVPLEACLPHRIGFVGGGQMALALAKGFMAAGLVAPDQVSKRTYSNQSYTSIKN